MSQLKLPYNIPKGVCHCDTHYSNFLYKDTKISAVLDFDDASYTYLLYDIASMIYFWAWPRKGELNFNRAQNILKEYSKYRELTEVEKRHLYDFLKMSIFMSIGWFIYDDDDFFWEKKKIEFLNSFGREKFYSCFFNQMIY